MNISIIIPTCNRNKILLKTINACIQILPKITSNYEIIIINDGLEDFLFNHPNVKIHKNIKKGVASARNFGVSLSTSENILFLDDDILITSEALLHYWFFFNCSLSNNHCLNIQWKFPFELIKLCKKSNFGRFLIKINYTEMKGWMKNEKWSENDEFIVPNLASYALGIKKQNFLKVNGYNESYPFSGFEDYDFSNRIHDAGIKVLLNTKYTVFHNEEDRMEPKGWFDRRYREGATRAVYVKITNEHSLVINPTFIKRIIFSLSYYFSFLLLFITKKLTFSKQLDFISFKIFHLLTGAFIWKGYHEYSKKN